MLLIRVTKGNTLVTLIFFMKNGGERTMSNKYLGPADRQLIAEKWAAYASVREIAALVGVAPKTIYQELRRGNNGTLDKNSRQSYNPDLAQRRFQESLRRRGKPLNRARAASE